MLYSNGPIEVSPSVAFGGYPDNLTKTPCESPSRHRINVPSTPTQTLATLEATRKEVVKQAQMAIEKQLDEQRQLGIGVHCLEARGNAERRFADLANALSSLSLWPVYNLEAKSLDSVLEKMRVLRLSKPDDRHCSIRVCDCHANAKYEATSDQLAREASRLKSIVLEICNKCCSEGIATADRVLTYDHDSEE